MRLAYPTVWASEGMPSRSGRRKGDHVTGRQRQLRVGLDPISIERHDGVAVEPHSGVRGQILQPPGASRGVALPGAHNPYLRGGQLECPTVIAWLVDVAQRIQPGIRLAQLVVAQEGVAIEPEHATALEQRHQAKLAVGDELLDDLSDA